MGVQTAVVHGEWMLRRGGHVHGGRLFSERGKGGEGGGALWGCVFEAGECSEERSDLKDHPNVPGVQSTLSENSRKRNQEKGRLSVGQETCLAGSATAQTREEAHQTNRPCD